MAKFLIQGSYTAEGVKGLLKEGGSKRRAAVEELVKSIGAKVEAMYFSFGDSDVFVIVDGPDNVAAAAAALTVNASGTIHLKTTVLLTPEEIDQAAKKAVAFRPAGR